MTAHDDFDRQLSDWFAARPPPGEPEHLLGDRPRAVVADATSTGLADPLKGGPTCP